MSQALDAARQCMRRLGLWSPRQQMGRRWPMGCVALEITQRCNLDCTACYLSESSQALHDLPMSEVLRRIEEIRRWYGPGTDVQITGGDPTLRAADELAAIIGAAARAGLRPTLMTNGIRASRPLLMRLAGAGLEAVAFHVDTTQQRRNGQTEAALDALRLQYVERSRGLPLAVYFNTTLHAGNLHELPALVRFFVAHSDVVRLASFQLHAETGRGTLRPRGAAVSLAAVLDAIRRGAGAALNFDAMDIGHPHCNRYAMALVAGGQVCDALDDAVLVERLLEATARVRLERARPWRAAAAFARGVLARPALLGAALGWAARKAWRMRGGLLAARGRVRKISFFVHNFMDARQLCEERVAACSFMVAGADGPVSMCAYNARRDHHLLQPVRMGAGYWHAASGTLDAAATAHPVRLTPRTTRGRARAA